MSLFPSAVITRSFEFGATFEILMKDVDLAIEQGEALGVPMWVCQAARLVLLHGVYQGRAQQDLVPRGANRRGGRSNAIMHGMARRLQCSEAGACGGIQRG